MRIFDPEVLVRNMAELELRSRTRALACDRRLAQRYHHVVTGPTGSGKTHHPYSTLKRARRREVNVCTIEDPIEMVRAGSSTRCEIAAGHRPGFRRGRAGADAAGPGHHHGRRDPRPRRPPRWRSRRRLTGHLALSTRCTPTTRRRRSPGCSTWGAGLLLNATVARHHGPAPGAHPVPTAARRPTADARGGGRSGTTWSARGSRRGCRVLHRPVGASSAG